MLCTIKLVFSIYKKIQKELPEFKHKGKLYQNPVEFALGHIGGKWKMPILWRLRERRWRYGELQRSLKNITTKMLTPTTS